MNTTPVGSGSLIYSPANAPQRHICHMGGSDSSTSPLTDSFHIGAVWVCKECAQAWVVRKRWPTSYVFPGEWKRVKWYHRHACKVIKNWDLTDEDS